MENILWPSRDIWELVAVDDIPKGVRGNFSLRAPLCIPDDVTFTAPISMKRGDVLFNNLRARKMLMIRRGYVTIWHADWVN